MSSYRAMVSCQEMRCTLAVIYVVPSGMRGMDVSVYLCHQACYKRPHSPLLVTFHMYSLLPSHTTPNPYPSPSPSTHTHTHTCRICLITTTQGAAATTIVTTLPPLPPHIVTPPPVTITPHIHAPHQPGVAPVAVEGGHLRYGGVLCSELSQSAEVCVGVQKRKTFGCYEANIEESERSRQLPGIEPRTVTMNNLSYLRIQ